jgi:hypothetical protein
MGTAVDPKEYYDRIEMMQIYSKDLNEEELRAEITKHHFNISKVKQLLQLKELRSIYHAILLLPIFLRSFPEEITIYFDPTIFEISNAVDGIALSTRWFWFDSNFQSMSFFHELAHHIATLAYSLDKSSQWVSVDGTQAWSRIDQLSNGDFYAYEGLKDGFITDYAKTTNLEDFAESVTAYRLAPNLLKNVSVNKFNFLKKVIFGELDYTNKDYSTQNQVGIFKLEREKNWVKKVLSRKLCAKKIAQCKSLSSTHQSQCLINGYIEKYPNLTRKILGNDFYLLNYLLYLNHTYLNTLSNQSRAVLKG